MKLVRLAVMVGLVSCLAASQVGAQVMQLGKARQQGRVVQASCCDGSGGVAYESGYGMTGIGGGGGCGACGACGTGGFFGRGLAPVAPCACGGSLIADMAMGAKRVVDNTVACVFGHVFGGLQAISCHASGTFAALQCATAMGCCGSCGSTSCDGGCAGGGEIYADGGYSVMDSSPAYAPTATPSIEPSPASTPQPEIEANPFLDDPPAVEPQAGRGTSIRQRTIGVIKPASAARTITNPLGGSRYYSGKSASFRR